MAKKLLGIVKVYVDASLPPSESSYTAGKNSSKTVEIVLNPNEKLDNSEVEFSLIDTLAHELGHFTNRLAKRPAQLAAGYPLSSVRTTIQAEKEAWNTARMIRPEIGAEQERDSLASYEELEAYGSLPLGLAAMLGARRERK